MAEVIFKAATRRYPGSPGPAVNELDLHVEDGEFIVLVGPSGSGKSTALRMLAGLEPVDEGSIHIGEKDVTSIAPQRRDIAMVFQDYALYPHMTVAGNMEFALKLAGVKAEERARRVNEAAALLGIERLLDRRPKALSGGQRQRVAMGRAIVREPQVFLLDEPLSNLDAKLRVEMRGYIAELQRRLGTTTVYVTHDQVEAMTMGDRVAVLKDGLLQQCDAPREIYRRPANTFVAAFLGSPPMNLIACTHDGETISFGTEPLQWPAGIRPRGDRVVVGIRPEQLTFAPSGAGLRGVVTLVEELGSDAYVHVRLEQGTTTTNVVVRQLPDQSPPPGTPVIVAAETSALLLFDADTGVRLENGR